jgi:hypothetical protein
MGSRLSPLDENYVHVMKVVGGYQVTRRKRKPLPYIFDGPEIDHIRAFTNGAKKVLNDADWSAFLKAIGAER